MLLCHTLTPNLQFGANCYLLNSGDEYCVIDPSVDYDNALGEFPEIAGKIKYIILTHSHFDHILALEDWVEKTSVIPSMSSAAYENVKDSRKNCYWQFFRMDNFYSKEANVLNDGVSLPLGDTSLEIIATPGHTSGSISILTDGMIFTGDTLFSGGSYGRYDLPTANPGELSRSIDKLLSCEGDRVIYSGHGEPTTLEQARKYRYL